MSGPKAFSVALNRCGPGCEGGNPAGCQQVAEIGDVVAVQVGQRQSRQAVGAQTDRRPTPGWPARRDSGRG